MVHTLSLALRRYRQVDLCESQTSWNLLVTKKKTKKKDFKNIIIIII